MTQQDGSARVIDPRYPAAAVPSITGLHLSPGGPADLVNISRSGMLVEGRMRMAPATRVTVMVEGRFAAPCLEGTVVRCQVSSISGATVRYQFAIQFDERLEPSAIESRPHPQTDPVPAPSSGGAGVRPARSGVAVNRW